MLCTLIIVVRHIMYLLIIVVFYGCETWSLTLREERRLNVSGNVLRRIFVS